jgi:hypothetical protein
MRCLCMLHADCGNTDGSTTARVIQSVKTAVRAQESEIKRWRHTFDSNVKTVVNGEKCALMCIGCSRLKDLTKCRRQILGS